MSPLNPETKITELLLAEPEKFNEYIMCLFNKGLGHIEYDYLSDRNFYYHITNNILMIKNSNKTTPNTKTVPLSAESGRGAAPRPRRLLEKAGENFFLFFCCLSFLTD